ncbi:MAG: SDR family oxidoreductase [Candidatus Devosia euplotis]|nr:SDR family oxidoreductase [Candidatus Devosia euplotis]
MNSSVFGLDGKTVLISGADRDVGMLDGLDLSAAVLFDQADSKATRAAIQRHLAEHGASDAVASNAGFTRAETLDQLDDDVWASELTINLNGAYAMTDPIVAARGSGSLIFIASVNALGHYGNPAYSATKAGLVAYARAVAVERGGQGVRANVICPGSVRTPAWDHWLAADPTLLDNVLPHYPLGRMVLPVEVANAAVFLASDAASGITGTVLPVDAGLTAGNLIFVDGVLRGK